MILNVLHLLIKKPSVRPIPSHGGTPGPLTYLEPSRTSTMEPFEKIIKD